MTFLNLFNFVTDSPANLGKKPINSSDSSLNQTDRSIYTEQDKEEERKRPGLEQEGGQEQTAEEINPDPEIHEEQSCINTDKQDKQTDSDSVSQRQLDDGLSKQEEVPNKSKMTDKGQSFKLTDNNTKGCAK